MDATPHQVLFTDRGMRVAERVLGQYLPGFSLGLVELSANRILMPGSTRDALAIEYGDAAVRPILEKAGVTQAEPVDDGGAIALLRARDTSVLRPRAALAAVAGLDWHLDAIGVRGAWALLGGPHDIDWGGVRVGHLDTGYTQHPAFGFGTAAGPWVQVALGKTIFKSASEMSDAGPGGGVDPLSFSFDGHGTRTGSTICGHAPTASGGAFYGVAPKVPLVPVRIADHVWINHAQRQLALGIDHLVDDCGVGVLSLSMGIKGAFVLDELRDAIDKAYNAGVIFVCAAGNIVSDVVAPARLSRTLAIGGVENVDGTLRPWSGASHGPEVDISAPAAGIRRANMKLNKPPIYAGGGDGTSFATAMTAGAAALWLAHHGAALATTYPQPWQRVEAFAQLLRDTARTPPDWQPGSFGTGVLDVEALLKAPLPAPATTPAPNA